MTVHDVIFTSDFEAGKWSPWDLWRHEYETSQPESSLVKDLDDDMRTTSSRLAVYRYVTSPGGWKLLAKQANFLSTWGPAFKVFT